MNDKIPGIITTDEAAQLLGVHRNYVPGILERAGINGQRVGTAYAWPEQAVKRLAFKRRMKSAQRKVGGRA